MNERYSLCHTYLVHKIHCYKTRTRNFFNLYTNTYVVTSDSLRTNDFEICTECLQQPTNIPSLREPFVLCCPINVVNGYVN